MQLIELRAMDIVSHEEKCVLQSISRQLQQDQMMVLLFPDDQ